MEGNIDQNLFEDIVTSIDKLDQGMTFHEESCGICTVHPKAWTKCEEWLDMIEQWNFLNLAVIRHMKDVSRTDN
jgi:hypothetical protein